MTLDPTQIMWIIGACATGATVIFHIGMSIGGLKQRLTSAERDIQRHEEALQVILEEGPPCRPPQ